MKESLPSPSAEFAHAGAGLEIRCQHRTRPHLLSQSRSSRPTAWPQTSRFDGTERRRLPWPRIILILPSACATAARNASATRGKKRGQTRVSDPPPNGSKFWRMLRRLMSKAMGGNLTSKLLQSRASSYSFEFFSSDGGDRRYANPFADRIRRPERL